jgi:glutathione peroxidase
VDLYQIPVETASGQASNLSAYRRSVLLIVNTANKCGFTPQYADLSDLAARWQDHDFAVLAFPSNDFHKQELGTNAEIQSYCSAAYGVSLPVFAKVSVEPSHQQAPLFHYLTSAANAGFPRRILWNFEKFLLGRASAAFSHAAPSHTL